LVEGVQAQYVLFGTGYRNRWGFPRPEVLARWQESGAVTYTTAASGAIEVVVRAASIEAPRAYRQHHRRYWQTAVTDEND
jgi:competence protein ComEC